MSAGRPEPDLTGAALTYPGHILDLVEPRLAGAGPAVVDRDAALSYPELRARSAAVAAALRERGVGPDDVVLIHARLSRWAVIAMLGVLRAGARYVALDVAFPAERQRYLLRAAAARVTLVEPGLPPLPDRVDPIHLDALPTGARSSGASTRPPDAPPTDDVPPINDPVRASIGQDIAGAGRGPFAYTCFTSGSTGRPKGVTISAAALAYSTAARLAYYPEPVRAFLLCSSISFDSSVAGIYWTLACGGTLVIPSDRPTDLVAVGRAASRHEASHLLMVPSLYNIALRGGLGRQLTSLSTVIVAGEACPPELVARHLATLPRARLYNEYGPTEATVWCTVHACQPADARARAVPIGAPIPGTSLYLRAPDGGPVAAGAPGELYVGGPGLAVSRDPDGHESPFVTTLDGQRLYRTGDLASVRPDGELDFHGRVDHQLKLGGVRVERAEIEHALATGAGIDAAGVGVVPETGPGQRSGRARLVGFVVPTDGTIDRRRLREHLLTLLPAAALPARVEPVASLPVLPNGKVDHGELDRLAQAALGDTTAEG